MEYIRTVDFTVHLAFNTPLPDPDLPFAKSV